MDPLPGNLENYLPTMLAAPALRRGYGLASEVEATRRGVVSILLGATLLLLGSSPVRGHGDDAQVIEALTLELSRAPDADLYIRRGELFRHHQEWAKAEADFTAATRLAPELPNLDFFRARNWLEGAEPQRALPLIQRFVAAVPDEPEGWFLRGDVHAALGEHQLGAAHYAEGLARARSPRPEHFLRRARFLASSPTFTAAEVIAALDDGLARLGPVIALVEYALELELERKNYAGALERVAAALLRAPRREAWLVKQGDILVLSGRKPEAVASYRAALAAIEELPERYRTSPAMDQLARATLATLNRLPSE